MAVGVESVLAELEGVDHHRRVRRMVELGRASRGDPGVAALLASMAAGGWYERRLAVFAGYGSRDTAAAARACDDASRTVRGAALAVLAVIGGDDVLAERLDALSGRARRRYALVLVRRRRRRPVDVVLRRLAARPDGAAAREILHFGSTGVVAELAPALLDGATHGVWHRLAEHHPDVAAAALRREIEAATGPSALLRGRAGTVIRALDRRPDLALELITATARYETVWPTRELAVQRPAQVADLLLGTDQPTTFPAAPAALRRLDTERVVRLARHRKLGPDARLLRHLRPADRTALFRAVGTAWRDGAGAVPVELLVLLDGPTRVAEARRHLALPQLRTRPAQRLRYAALLPWAQAAAELGPALADPDAETRAVALGALIGVARFHPDHLPDALALVTARRNEQDPVRGPMLAALAGLPPRRWRAEHLDALGRVVRDALDAADCSPVTADALQRLVVGLVPDHPERAGEWLAAVALERGALTVRGLVPRLTDADVRALAPALAGVLDAWAPRERHRATLAMAGAFGRRLGVFDELVEHLLAVVREGLDDDARYALALVAAELPRRLPGLVPELLAADPTWLAVHDVSWFLHRHRQDLLTPYLRGTAHRGRFGTGRTRLLLPLDSGFDRWTAAQQEVFAQVLVEVATDAGRDTAHAVRAVWTLAALPAVAPDLLAGFAAADSPFPARRDAALRALGALDSDAGVPVLVAALSDERAAVAVHALRGAVLQMPADRALELLRGVDPRRVAVAKEVARLLGDLPDGAGHADLLAMAARPLHRDVRVAVLRALWTHLERPRTWPVLRAAATDPDPAVVRPVLRIPADGVSARARGELVELLAAVLSHPAELVRLEALRRLRGLPVADPDRVLGPPLLTALASPLLDEVEAAAEVLVGEYGPSDAELLGTAAARLLPDRRALGLLLSSVLSRVVWDPEPYVATVRAVLDQLDTDPMTAAQRPRLALAGLGAQEAAARLRAQAADGTLHCDALAEAVDSMGRVHRGDTGFAPALEGLLADDPDERLRRVALAALVGHANEQVGWTEEHARRLEVYRSDPSPLVAGAALFTVAPDFDPDDEDEDEDEDELD